MKQRLNLTLLADARDVGSCNFCNQMPQTVNVVRSNAPHCNIQVRFCEACLQELIERTR